MSKEAARVLAELRQDHRNMAVLLNLLQREVDHVAHEDETADFELMQDIMRYMTVYPDTTHHPKEDLIYAGMRAKRPDLAQGLEAVEGDHEDIAESSKRLLADIQAVVAGAYVTRDRVISDAREYVDRLRNHMDWEEGDLFARAEAMMDELEIDTSHLDADDPLFGSEGDSSFANLSQSIGLAAQ
ncbi:MAG: hemerythrin domain-containing protein [Woeseiaceae bacterium]|nr:hemerythrin domain-containing protein [Woeseiaceae bacterium]